MNLPEEYQHKVAARGSSLYYSLLFTQPSQREAIIGLHALQFELVQITEHFREAAIAKTKLEWWQQEIQRMYQQQAQHPITQYLQTVVEQYHLSQALFTEWLAGCLLKLESDHLCTLQDLNLFCYRDYGICALLSAYVLGFKEHISLTGVHDISIVIEVVHLLQDLPQHLQRGICYLPLDILEKHQVNEADLTTPQLSEKLHKPLQDIWQFAINTYQQGIHKIAKTDKAAMTPLLIYAELSYKLGQELAKENFAVFDHKLALTPIRKLWTAWKTNWLSQ
jgi:phytoene synthase